MDREDEFASPPLPTVRLPSTTNPERASTVGNTMASVPLIIMEDGDIVSTPIITLEEDSDTDNETMDQIDVQEIMRAADAMAPEGAMDLEMEGNEHSNTDEETVVYVGTQAEATETQRVTLVDEVPINVESEEDERRVNEAVVHIEIQEEVTVMEGAMEEDLLIDFEAAPDEDIGRGATSLQYDKKEETCDSSSLLDLMDMEDLNFYERNGDLATAQLSKTGPKSPPPRGPSSSAKEHFFMELDTLRKKDSTGSDHDSDRDSFRSFSSDDDEPEMEAGNKQIWKELKRERWVAQDFSTILHPASDEKVPMPRGFQERKRALLDIFLLLSRVVFFIDVGVRRERIFALIPEKFWHAHFTFTDTKQLLDARDKEICINMLSRTKTVIEEWRLKYGFPKVPESPEEVKAANPRWQRMDRQSRIEELLQPKSERSDRWMRHIFLDFEDCLPWQDIIAADGEFRRVAIQKVVVMAELCFGSPISIGEEIQDLSMRRQVMKGLVRDQLNGVFAQMAKLSIDG